MSLFANEGGVPQSLAAQTAEATPPSGANCPLARQRSTSPGGVASKPASHEIVAVPSGCRPPLPITNRPFAVDFAAQSTPMHVVAGLGLPVFVKPGKQEQVKLLIPLAQFALTQGLVAHSLMSTHWQDPRGWLGTLLRNTGFGGHVKLLCRVEPAAQLQEYRPPPRLEQTDEANPAAF